MINKTKLKIKAGMAHQGYLDSVNISGFFFLFYPEVSKNDYNTTKFTTCRESLAHYISKEEKKYYIGFRCSQNKLIIKIDSFFNAREETLNIPESERTVIFKTNNIYNLIIKPANFWLENTTRLSLFTLFLRMSAVYPSYSFEKSIDKYDLAYETKDAILYFMEGNTIPVYKRLARRGYVSGWHSQFSNRNENYFKKYLKKPKTPKIDFKKINARCCAVSSF